MKPTSLSSNEGKPLNLAHRGASIAAPPNTLAAFKKAVELGADGVEFDVQLSADGVPVVIHDFTVDATTDGSGRVADMPLAQLHELDAGSTFDPAFAGERIPTLAEVLETVGHQLFLNVELKTLRLRSQGLEQAVIAQIERHRQKDNVLLSSFNLFSLRRVKRMAPQLPVGLLYTPTLPLSLHFAQLACIPNAEAHHPEHTMVDQHLVTRARRRGYRVNTWTVDDPAEMRRLIDLSIDGIITNVPDVLHGILQS